MKVFFSNEVNNGMRNYLETLKSQGKYNVSAKRAQEKYLEMKREVENAAQNAKTCQVCLYRVLGQTFDANGNPKKPNLRKFTYTDKQSKSKWVFSFLIDDKHDEVTVYRMSHSSNVVKEEKDGASIQRLTKTEFRQIVQEEVVKLLSEMIK